MDKLKNVLDSVEKWCKDNDISIFYGSIDENVATEVSWSKNSDDDWLKYLSTLRKLGIKIIIVDIITNKIDPLDETIIDYKRLLENDDLIEYEKALKIIKSTKNQIAYFNLSFIDNNTCYSYAQISDWVDDYLFVQEAFSAEEDEYEAED